MYSMALLQKRESRAVVAEAVVLSLEKAAALVLVEDLKAHVKTSTTQMYQTLTRAEKSQQLKANKEVNLVESVLETVVERVVTQTLVEVSVEVKVVQQEPLHLKQGVKLLLSSKQGKIHLRSHARVGVAAEAEEEAVVVLTGLKQTCPHLLTAQVNQELPVLLPLVTLIVVAAVADVGRHVEDMQAIPVVTNQVAVATQAHMQLNQETVKQHLGNMSSQDVVRDLMVHEISLAPGPCAHHQVAQLRQLIQLPANPRPVETVLRRHAKCLYEKLAMKQRKEQGQRKLMEEAAPLKRALQLAKNSKADEGR